MADMWFKIRDNYPDWSVAQAHLRRVDPAMERIIAKVGPCLLHPRRDYFVLLCQAIFNQQISMAAANKLFARFRDCFPRRCPTPQRVRDALGHPSDPLSGVGLSRQKRRYLLDLSHGFLDGRVPTRKFARMEDEQIIEALTQIHGIGRWTAEMFLMFVLNRTDVLPMDDLGLQESMRVAYGLRERPGKSVMQQLAEPWRPWRTVATWYLWCNHD